MRLADKIIERAQRPTTPCEEDFRAHWVALLRAAECFEVDAGAGELAQATTWTSPTAALSRTRASAALPAPTTWFEWRGPSAGMGPLNEEPPRPGTIVPNRCGVLVQTDETLRRGVASWIWELPGVAQLEACPLAVCFDWRSNPAEVPCVVRASFAFHGADWVRHLRKVHDQSRCAGQDFEPFVSEERRYGLILSPLLPATWQALDVLAAQDQAKAIRIIHAIQRDLEGEALFLAGMVICLTSLGLLDVSAPPDMTRLNAARRKRRKTELLSFRKIAASGRNVIRLSDRGGDLEKMRAVYAA